MIQEETKTIKIGKDTYTNDTKNNKILKNNTIHKHYSIVGYSQETRELILREGNTFKTQHINIAQQELPTEFIQEIITPTDKKTNTTTKNKKTTKKNKDTKDN